MNRLARHVADELSAAPLFEEVKAFEKLSAGVQRCASLQTEATCTLDLVLLYQALMKFVVQLNLPEQLNLERLDM
eukprot:997651-Prorocentrum_minimum.AAC.1